MVAWAAISVAVIWEVIWEVIWAVIWAVIILTIGEIMDIAIIGTEVDTADTPIITTTIHTLILMIMTILLTITTLTTITMIMIILTTMDFIKKIALPQFNWGKVFEANFTTEITEN